MSWEKAVVAQICTFPDQNHPQINGPNVRDWTTAIQACNDQLEPGARFQFADIYTFEDKLAEVCPDNQHIRTKIRQQTSSGHTDTDNVVQRRVL